MMMEGRGTQCIWDGHVAVEGRNNEVNLIVLTFIEYTVCVLEIRVVSYIKHVWFLESARKRKKYRSNISEPNLNGVSALPFSRFSHFA
jgi:hypothetical protein